MFKYTKTAEKLWVIGLLLLSACGGGGSNGSGGVNTDNTFVTSVNGDSSINSPAGSQNQIPAENLSGLLATDGLTVLPAGNIDSYGTIVVADESGLVSDLVGSFFNIEPAVQQSSLLEFILDSSRCTVEVDEITDFRDIAATFTPQVPGTDTAISAGDTVLLSSNGNSYATLFEQGLGEFIFYGIGPATAAPVGVVPDSLFANISGDMFPQFGDVAFPASSALQGFSFVTDGRLDQDIGINTEFTWDASTDTASMIRISTSTTGGFFLENSKKLNCLLQDTGNFRFGRAIQQALGESFSGQFPVVSRVSINSFVMNQSMLFVVRETFLAD